MIIHKDRGNFPLSFYGPYSLAANHVGKPGFCIEFWNRNSKVMAKTVLNCWGLYLSTTNRNS